MKFVLPTSTTKRWKQSPEDPEKKRKCFLSNPRLVASCSFGNVLSKLFVTFTVDEYPQKDSLLTVIISRWRSTPSQHDLQSFTKDFGLPPAQWKPFIVSTRFGHPEDDPMLRCAQFTWTNDAWVFITTHLTDIADTVSTLEAPKAS